MPYCQNWTLNQEEGYMYNYREQFALNRKSSYLQAPFTMGVMVLAPNDLPAK